MSTSNLPIDLWLTTNIYVFSTFLILFTKSSPRNSHDTSLLCRTMNAQESYSSLSTTIQEKIVYEEASDTIYHKCDPNQYNFPLQYGSSFIDILHLKEYCTCLISIKISFFIRYIYACSLFTFFKFPKTCPRGLLFSITVWIRKIFYMSCLNINIILHPIHLYMLSFFTSFNNSLS